MMTESIDYVSRYLECKLRTPKLCTFTKVLGHLRTYV